MNNICYSLISNADAHFIQPHSFSLACPSTSYMLETQGFISLNDINHLPEDLNIKKVRRLESHEITIKSVPTSLQTLKFIHIVDLSGTMITGEALKLLPLRIEKLNVEDCEDVEHLPIELKSYEFLSVVILSKTFIRNNELKNLPNSVEELKIDACKRISELPTETQQLVNLKIVNVSKTKLSHLDHLPMSVEIIYAQHCSLKEFGSTFTKRRQLRELHFQYSSLPTTFSHLCLDLTNCIVNLKKIVVTRQHAKDYFANVSREKYTDQKFIRYIRNDGNSTLALTEIKIEK